MHHCIISVCLLFLHGITAKQRLSFLSLSLSCLAVHATTHKHTRRHTRTLCLFFSSVSPPAQTLCAQPYNGRSVTRGRTVLALYRTHPSLCVAPPLFLPKWRGRSVSHSACQSKKDLQSGGEGDWVLTGTFVGSDPLELDPKWR